jgi:hypothetical protein
LIHRSPFRLVLTVLLAAFVLGGCVEGGVTAATAGPSASAVSVGRSVAPSFAPSASTSTSKPTSVKPSPTEGATRPTSTETAWGRIWDSLPDAFPTYPGAEPSDTGDGPASAVLDVPATTAKAVAWYDKALRKAGYTIEALGGPLEDGSRVIDAVGVDRSCRVQASIMPSGSRSIATILMAADCPFR